MPPLATPEKPGRNPRPGNDDLIPLVIASSPGLAVNCNRMKDLDPQKRTYYALEHKFRKFKARAKEICDAEGGEALAVGKASVEKTEGKSLSIASNPYEDLIPLLIASIPGRAILNFNRMKELDPHGRSASSFEHKFRKFKAAAKDILDAGGGKATDEGNPSPKKNSTKKRKTKGEGAKKESDNVEMTPTKKRRAVKGEPKNANAGAEVADPQASRHAGVKERSLEVKVKKEAQDGNESAEAPGAKSSAEGSEDARLDANVTKRCKPASQPRPPKKGLARVIKKEANFVSEAESEDGEDSVKPTAQPKPQKKGLARIVKKGPKFLSEMENEDKEEPIKANSTQKKKKAAGASKTEAEAKGKGTTKGKPTTECLAEDAASELGGATTGAGESSGAPSKESAIRLLFE